MSVLAVPLLSLAQPALDLGASLNLGEPGEPGNGRDIGGVWNAITRAADLVKDGERLENLAWRHWAKPRHTPRHERCTSASSIATASSVSIRTPISEHAPAIPSTGKPTFGRALTLLLEDDHSSFKDWVTEAQRNAITIPSLSVPDTPVANVEIRLVEPTPVPSRVGSLGGSMATSNLLSVGGRVNSWSTWSEEHPAQSAQIPEEKPAKGKFFLPSSPTKSSSEDDSSRADDNPPLSKFVPRRRKTSLSLAKRRKQRAKRELASESLTKNESSGWEDDIEEKDEDDWSDEPDEPKPKAVKAKGKVKEQDEAQKKREMFAKQQIFGKGPSPGLLSGIFRTGGSMVDLTKALDAKQGIRPCPTHGNLVSLAQSPVQLSTLLRSKSAVAMPLQTGLSVTSRSGNADAESMDEGTDDDYLATSTTKKKLTELASKREQRDQTQPVPTAAVRIDVRGVVMPMSPTTRRREIITREMSESLRRSLILERQKSSTGSGQVPRQSTSPRRNVLQGGFLRPLTRVGGEVNRVQSSANLAALDQRVSPEYAPPAMVRRSTEDGSGPLNRRTMQKSETGMTSRRHNSTDFDHAG